MVNNGGLTHYHTKGNWKDKRETVKSLSAKTKGMVGQMVYREVWGKKKKIT